jgi:glycosyltransferase involved in cell wall biosynthesis
MMGAAAMDHGQREPQCSGDVPRLAILATHPIQYHAPWYRGLAKDGRLQIKVFFCHKATPEQQASAGFGVPFDWDVPLLEGYEHEFLKNVAAHPRTSSFNGLDVPGIGGSLRKGAFDAVLVNGWNYKAAWQTIWASKQLGLPVLTRGDSHLHTPRSGLKNWVKEMFYPLMLRAFDGFLDVGQWSRDYYLHYGAREDRIFRVPHVIDEVSFLSRAEGFQAERDAIRADWNLPSDATVFLFAGKFIAKKNPVDFLRALEIALRGGGRIVGIMVGDGPLRAVCESLVSEAGLPVTFCGFLNQSEIIKAYIAADCLVLPSDGGETWGIVVNEAMWNGLPCIVSDQVGCGPDLVAGQGTGEVFPLHNEAALAAAMVYLARNPEQRLACGARARAVIQAYSVASAVEGTVNAVAAVKRGRRA